MPIKNLDNSLFSEDKNKKNKKEKNKINPEAFLNSENASDIQESINNFMDNLPPEVLEQFNNLSADLYPKLENMNLGDLFNVEVNRVEFNTPSLMRLFKILTKFNSKELEEKEISAKIDELSSFLENKLANNNENNEVKEEIDLNKLANDKIKEIASYEDDVLSVLVEPFNKDEFINEINFKLEENNYILTDLNNIDLINPLTNNKLDLANAIMVYGINEISCNSILGDRVLLYLNKEDRSNYIILYAYKSDNKYQFYIPKKTNYGLFNIEDKFVLKKVKQAFFRYKNVKSCLEEIESIFVLKNEVKMPLLNIGEIIKDNPYYSGDSLIKIGSFNFKNDSEEFRIKFDISDLNLPFYIKIKANWQEEKINDFVNKIKEYDFNSAILNNFELKFNNLKNYLYIEL